MTQVNNAKKEEDQVKQKEILSKYAELSEYHNSTIGRLRQVTKDLANNNELIRDFFEDQMAAERAKKIGAAYNPKYSAEEHPEQLEMADILVPALNRLIENPPTDILQTLGIVIVGQTDEVELGRALRTLAREAPRELSKLDKALQESIIDISRIGFNV